MKITTVFFDLDNTLLNHSAAEKRALSVLKAKYFLEIPEIEFEREWRDASKKYWRLYLEGSLDFEEQRIKRVVDIWRIFGEEVSEENARSIFYEYLVYYEKYWDVFPHVKDVLQSLHRKGIILGIITNGNKEQQVKKLERTGIKEFFREDLIIVSDIVKFAKPGEEIFLYAQKAAHCQPGNLLYVGDNYELDIEPAMKLNWNTVHVNHFKDTSMQTVNDFRKLLEIVPD